MHYEEASAKLPPSGKTQLDKVKPSPEDRERGSTTMRLQAVQC